MPDSSNTTWQKAVSFAAAAHAGQIRKDGKTPYIAHPMRVALTVRHVFGVDDEIALATAILHDVIEDTTTDYDDLRERFGQEVAEAVAALTKDARLPNARREAEYDRQLSEASWQAKLVKLGDVYDNVSDCTSVSQRKKAVEKGRRAVTCAGDDPRLAAAVARVNELLANAVIE